MKDRRTTRIRSDLKQGDFVTRRKGWFIPLKNKPNASIWGVYDGQERLINHFIGRERDDNYVYYSNKPDKKVDWEANNDYIDLAPKGNFVTRFVKRLKNLAKLERYFRENV